MTLLVDVAIRSGVVVLAGLAAHALLARRSAALRHAVLAAAIVAAGTVAPLTLIVPAWHAPGSAAMSNLWSAAFPQSVSVSPTAPATNPAPRAATAIPGTADSATTVSRSEPLSPPSARPLPLAIWATGAAAGVLVLIAGIGHLMRIERRARRVGGRLARVAEEVSRAHGLRRPVALLLTATPDVLATWGLWRPRVLLPAHAREWTEERIRVVLAHELAHIRRRDWFIQLVADVVRCAYWFNPLFWIACRRLRQDGEQACDDSVLRAGVAPDDYAAHLLALARRCRRPRATFASAMPMARPSTLERRIIAMLNPGLNREALTARALAFTAVLLAGVTLSAAALRTAQTTPLPLTGAVYDSTGAVMPQVELTVLDDQQRTVQTGTTDGSGRFTLAAIAPGHYVLRATLMGFRELRQEIDLKQAKDWQRAITLQVGTLQETISIRAQRPTASRPSTGATAPAPVRVGGNIRAPMKLADVRPVYPPSMREAGLEGHVPLEAIVNREGGVQSLRVLSATVHPDFAIAAIDAVRQWQYSPTLLNGQPVEVVIAVSIDFSLSDQ
jgi:TonB family protein